MTPLVQALLQNCPPTLKLRRASSLPPSPRLRHDKLYAKASEDKLLRSPLRLAAPKPWRRRISAIHADETGRYVRTLAACGPVGARRCTGEAAKRGTEGAETLKPDGIADLRDRQRRRDEKFLRPLDPFGSDVLVGRLAGEVPERSNEIEGRKPGHRGEPRDGQ